jgi:hypothetical protein
MTFLDNHNLATFTDNIRYHRFFSGAKCFAIYQILAIQPRELELIISQVFLGTSFLPIRLLSESLTFHVSCRQPASEAPLVDGQFDLVRPHCRY